MRVDKVIASDVPPWYLFLKNTFLKDHQTMFWIEHGIEKGRYTQVAEFIETDEDMPILNV